MYCETPLHSALERGDYDEVKQFLEVDLNRTNVHGQTLLHLATLEGQKEIVELLLENKNVNKNKTNAVEQTALHLALIEYELEIAQVLIENDIDVNIKDEDGFAAIHYALLKDYDDLGYSEIIQLLTDKNKDIDIAKCSTEIPIYLAAKHGNKKMVETIIKNANRDKNESDKKGQTALHLAIINNDLEIAKILIENNVDINIKDKTEREAKGIHYASQKDCLELINMLIDKNAELNELDKDYGTPLHYATMEGHKEIVKLLINNGNVNKNAINRLGQTPLQTALDWDKLEIAKLLIENNADVSINGNAAIQCASQKGDFDIFKMLIDKNANMNEKNKDGETPLHIASMNHNKEIVEFLVKSQNVNINERDKKGRTALHAALQYFAEEIAQLLIENDIDVTVKDVEGKTAFDVAIEGDCSEIIDMLKERGAK